MAKKSIVVTGATGYLGKHFIKELVKKNVLPICIVRPGSSSKIEEEIRSQVTVIEFSDDVEDLKEKLGSLQPDALVHLATHFVAEHSTKDLPLILSSNIGFGMNVVEAATLSGVKKILNVGTFWQHHSGKAYSPVSLYSASKKAFEDILQFYSESRGVSTVNLKFAAVYGPHDPRQKIINLLFKAAKEKTNLQMSPGKQLLDLIYIDDAVASLMVGLDILKTAAPGSFTSHSVSSRKLVTLKELVETLEAAAGSKVSVEWGVKAYRNREFFSDWKHDPVLPGWLPQVSLSEGLKICAKGFL